MNNMEATCPIWGTSATIGYDHSRDGIWVDSPRTGGPPGSGKYFISGTARAGIAQLDDRAKARLTSWLVDQRRLGNECPEVLSNTLKEIGQQGKNLSIHNRASRLLQYIASQTEEISQEHIFTSQEMAPLAAWSESINWEEVKYLLDDLCNKNWLERSRPSDENVYRLTVEGHARAEESASLLQEVKEEGKAIISTARSTAFGISLEEVQKQFKESQRSLNNKVVIWSIIGGVLLVGCIGTGVIFLKTGPPEGEWHQIAYHSALRVSILAMLGTATAFFFKIFRAHLHMREKNKHRQHVANCIGAFVESASSPEQRDLILGQLVESIIQFGSSGLLPREDESTYRSKITIDPIIKSLGLPTNQEK